MLAQPRRALGEIGNRVANVQSRVGVDAKPTIGLARPAATTTSASGMAQVAAATSRIGLAGLARRPGVSAVPMATSIPAIAAQPRQAPAPASGIPAALSGALPSLRSASVAGSVARVAAVPVAPVAPAVVHHVPELGSFDDIDLHDAHNPQACSEYVQEIYEYLRELELREKLPENFLSVQSEVTDRMRATLIDYLVDVHASFQMLPETLFLCINVLDRFLAMKPVAQAKLQMVGVTALLVAAKYEETYFPQINDFVRATDRSCGKPDLIRTERMVLSSLKFSLSVPTALSFLKRYAKAAQADNTIGMLSRFMAELSLMDAHICGTYNPSVVAAAAIYHALRCTHNAPWTATLQHYAGYTEADITACANELRELVKRTPAGKLQAIFKKYSQPKYLGVARLCVAEI